MSAPPKPFYQIRLFAFSAFALFLLFLLVVQNLGLPNPAFDSLHALPHYDKLGHFLLMGGLNFGLLLLLLPKRPTKKKKLILITTSLVSLVVALEEFSQAYLPHRTFSLLDLGASLLGIFVAACMVWSHR